MKTPEEFLKEHGIENDDARLSTKNVILLIKLRDADHELERLGL